MNRLATLVIVPVLLAPCAFSAQAASPSQSTPSSAEAQVRAFTLDFLSAIANAEWEPFRRFWADDAVMVAPSATDAPRLEGIAALQAEWERQFKLMREAAAGRGVTRAPFITIEPKGLRVDFPTTDVAVVNFYLDGDGRIRRRTFVAVRRAGVWKITHLHASDVPAVTPR